MDDHAARPLMNADDSHVTPKTDGTAMAAPARPLAASVPWRGTPLAGMVPLPLMPQQLYFWRAVFVCVGIVVAGGLGWFGLTLALDLPTLSGPLFSMAVLFGICGPIVAWHYANRRFSHYQAAWSASEGVVLRSGVLWRNEAWVPAARLQHIDVDQGPLDRRWGMATLTLHTAGSHDHRTRVRGLPVAVAHALREALLPVDRADHD